MSDDSETVEDTKKGSLAEVTDDSCTLEFIEIVPLVRPSDDYHTSEFIYPVVEVKPEELREMKHEPADENDNGDSHCYVKQEPAVGYGIIGSCCTIQVSSFMFMFHMFLHVMKLLKYKSTIGQELLTLLYSAEQMLCIHSPRSSTFLHKMTSWPPSLPYLTLPVVRGLRLDRHPLLRPQHKPNAQPHRPQGP